MQLQTLAQLFSDLRPAHRVRVPFFKLAAHTSPTKWNLYRYLLRRAPGDEVHCQFSHSAPRPLVKLTTMHDNTYAEQRLAGTYVRCSERTST